MSPVTNVATTRISAKSTSLVPCWRRSKEREYWSFLVDLQHGQEGLLRDFDGSELLHPPLAGLLLLEQFPLASDVAAGELCRHVLPIRLDRAARDDVAADRGLLGHFELHPRKHFLQCLDHLAAFALDPVTVRDQRHRVDLLLVDQDVELDERPGLEAQELIVERRVTAAHGLQAVEEVEDDFRERQLELDRHLPAG